MDKLELWKQGEPLFHDKLNEEVKAINELFEKLNKQNDISVNGFTDTVPLPHTPTVTHAVAEMWKKDGAGIVLSGYDNTFVGEAGLYARDVAFSISDKLRYVPCDYTLKKIADYKCLSDNGTLYQVIYLNNTHDVVYCSELKYSSTPLVHSNEKNVIYRRLSRIVADCKFASCGNQKKFVAIDTNEGFFNLNNGGGSSGGDDPIIYEPEMKGMVTTANEHKTWEELKTPQNVLYLFDMNSGLRTYITAQNCNGFIKLNTRLSTNC